MISRATVGVGGAFSRSASSAFAQVHSAQAVDCPRFEQGRRPRLPFPNYTELKYPNLRPIETSCRSGPFTLANGMQLLCCRIMNCR
ncbi:MAG: hypothetical protein WDO73_06780 [Ignavibacteriota bacterium]